MRNEAILGCTRRAKSSSLPRHSKPEAAVTMRVSVASSGGSTRGLHAGAPGTPRLRRPSDGSTIGDPLAALGNGMGPPSHPRCSRRARRHPSTVARHRRRAARAIIRSVGQRPPVRVHAGSRSPPAARRTLALLPMRHLLVNRCPVGLPSWIRVTGDSLPQGRPSFIAFSVAPICSRPRRRPHTRPPYHRGFSCAGG
jgi:hypothetical protein